MISKKDILIQTVLKLSCIVSIFMFLVIATISGQDTHYGTFKIVMTNGIESDSRILNLNSNTIGADPIKVTFQTADKIQFTNIQSEILFSGDFHKEQSNCYITGVFNDCGNIGYWYGVRE